ncbi:MAG: hypothetical protein PUF10_08190 [Bacteroidales bacterium]|nr:hypothetical protein [Bacteroidales bacterium]
MRKFLIGLIFGSFTFVNAQEIPVESLTFCDYDGNDFQMEQISRHKALFMVNNAPQCHGCAESIYDFLAKIKFKTANLYIVNMAADSYLEKRMLLQEQVERIGQSFDALYIKPREKIRFLETLGEQTYPLLLLYWKGGTTARVITNEEIFTDDVRFSDLRPEIQALLKNFAKD